MIKIWDKRSPINGVSAEEFLKSSPFLKTCNEIVLICKGSDEICYVEAANVLRNILGIDDSVSALEVGERYEQYLKDNNNKIEEQHKNEKTDIERLQEEYKRIKIELENTQKSLAEMMNLISMKETPTT